MLLLADHTGTIYHQFSSKRNSRHCCSQHSTTLIYYNTRRKYCTLGLTMIRNGWRCFRHWYVYALVFSHRLINYKHTCVIWLHHVLLTIYHFQSDPINKILFAFCLLCYFLFWFYCFLLEFIMSWNQKATVPIWHLHH